MRVQKARILHPPNILRHQPCDHDSLLPRELSPRLVQLALRVRYRVPGVVVNFIRVDRVQDDECREDIAPTHEERGVELDVAFGLV